MQGKADNLEQFAKRIETMVIRGGNTEGMERLICRALTNKKNPALAAAMAQKWVEWRFGKAPQPLKHEGTITHEWDERESLTDEQLRQVEQIIETANAGANPR